MPHNFYKTTFVWLLFRFYFYRDIFICLYEDCLFKKVILSILQIINKKKNKKEVKCLCNSNSVWVVMFINQDWFTWIKKKIISHWKVHNLLPHTYKSATMAMREQEVGVFDFVLLDEITLEKFMQNLKKRYVQWVWR